MYDIQVRKLKEDTYEVTVKGTETTKHTVVLAETYYRELTGGRIPPEQLLQVSFEFLLENEDNSMILPSFELPLINRYFPKYEKTIGGRF